MASVGIFSGESWKDLPREREGGEGKGEKRQKTGYGGRSIAGEDEKERKGQLAQFVALSVGPYVWISSQEIVSQRNKEEQQKSSQSA